MTITITAEQAICVAVGLVLGYKGKNLIASSIAAIKKEIANILSVKA